MKTLVATFLPLLLGAALITPTHAQIFGPSVAVTADTDVLNAGTTALAFDRFNQASGNTLQVNNVLFSGTLTQNGITLALTGFPQTAINGDNQQVPAMSTAFFQVLNFNYFQQSTTATPTLSLTHLIAGHTYELQLFDGSVFVTGTTNVQDGTSSGTLAYGPGSAGTASSGADYIVDTFVAGSSGTETITYSALTNNDYEIVNAVNLRDMGVSPEPSTFAMLLGGLVLLGLCGRRMFPVRV